MTPSSPARLLCATARNGVGSSNGSRVVGGANEHECVRERYPIRNAFWRRMVPPARHNEALSEKACILGVLG